MANLNQGYRSGNAFGRLANVSYDNNYGEDIALKPGYLLRIRDTYALVTGVEAMSVDLWFTDTVNVGITAVTSDVATDFDGTHGEALEQYGLASISAYYDLGKSTVAETDKTGNILAPDYDSGFISFKALEPYAGNLYHLCPTLPLQPKFMNAETGDWHSRSAFPPNTTATTDGGIPIGFKGDGTAEHLKQVGSVSAKLYIKQPSGVAKHTLDEASDGESARSTASETAIEGISGFLDGEMSPTVNPNWAYGMIVEHGEASLPAFRVVNDSDEYILDGRVRLVGWKYKILELSQEQLATLKAKAGGRLRFMYYNPVTYQSSGFLSDYLAM
jgi:hypothetical protein